MVGIEIIPAAVNILPSGSEGTEGTVVIRIEIEPLAVVLLPSRQKSSEGSVMIRIEIEPVACGILQPSGYHCSVSCVAVIPVAAVIYPSGYFGTVVVIVPVAVRVLPSEYTHITACCRGICAA